MLNHDGYEFHDLNKNHYRYKGTIEITTRSVKWTADLFVNNVYKGAVKGVLTEVGDDEGPVRRAVDVAVKAAIQAFSDNES